MVSAATAHVLDDALEGGHDSLCLFTRLLFRYVCSDADHGPREQQLIYLRNRLLLSRL